MNAQIAGAIFDFAAYLCTLDEPITVGRGHEVPKLMSVLTNWANERGVTFGRVDHRWNQTVDHRYIEICERCGQPRIMEDGAVVQPCGGCE